MLQGSISNSPTMLARFGPVGLGINRDMGMLALIAVLLVPDPVIGAQHRTVDGDGPSTGGPWADQVDQVAPQVADLRR